MIHTIKIIIMFNECLSIWYRHDLTLRSIITSSRTIRAVCAVLLKCWQNLFNFALIYVMFFFQIKPTSVTWFCYMFRIIVPVLVYKSFCNSVYIYGYANKPSCCWFICKRNWMAAYKSLKTKENSSWVFPKVLAVAYESFSLQSVSYKSSGVSQRWS